MNKDPCEKEDKEFREALEELNLWSLRASLPPVTTPIPNQEDVPVVYLTVERIHELTKAAQERDKAWERFQKANQALSERRRKYGK